MVFLIDYFKNKFNITFIKNIKKLLKKLFFFIFSLKFSKNTFLDIH